MAFLILSSFNPLSISFLRGNFQQPVYADGNETSNSFDSSNNDVADDSSNNDVADDSSNNDVAEATVGNNETPEQPNNNNVSHCGPEPPKSMNHAWLEWADCRNKEAGILIYT